MTEYNEGNVLVAGALRSIADDKIVAFTTDLFDPDLKMTQSEINKFDGGLQKEYGWYVTTEEKYHQMEHKPKVLYFIQDSDSQEDTNSVIIGDSLFIAGSFSNNAVSVTGNINNNNLILN